MYPKNVFWSGGLKVSDWELLHLGVPMFDPCFIWALAWQNPSWQKTFFDEIRADLTAFKVSYDTLLPVGQCIVLLRFIRHSEVMLRNVLSGNDEQAKINAKEALESHKRTLLNVLSLG